MSEYETVSPPTDEDLPSVPVPEVVLTADEIGEPPPAQGWYLDPFGRHAQRWFSGGSPTSLVRDATGAEAEDPPPADVPVPAGEDLVRGPEHQLADGADLLRADAATAVDQGSSEAAARDALDASGLWSAAAD